jgi:hypothetical protein
VRAQTADENSALAALHVCTHDVSSHAPLTRILLHVWTATASPHTKPSARRATGKRGVVHLSSVVVADQTQEVPEWRARRDAVFRRAVSCVARVCSRPLPRLVSSRAGLAAKLGLNTAKRTRRVRARKASRALKWSCDEAPAWKTQVHTV